MSTNETSRTTTAPPTETVDVGLWPHQYEAVFRCDRYRWLFEIGGRGSGKSFKDKVRIVRWAEMCTELAYGIFASTDAQLHTVLAPIRELIEDMGIDHRYEAQAPLKWRHRWQREGIRYPAHRLRSHKFWIWDTGAHFFTGSLVNNAYTRAKSIDFNAILIQEGTEPGVTLDAILTLFGACRCGKARRDKDGVWRCLEPGHLHQLVFAGNVPLSDPSHWIYKKNEQMLAQERVRELEGKPPFYKLLTSRTQDNPATGADYDDGLRAAFDPATYIEQTSGELKRNTALLSYHAFSEKNIVSSLTYDARRPLHIWFDWNATPATAGWGHDLRWDEVPEPMRRKGRHHFGIIGELFSDNDPMHTDQVANALLTDVGKSGKCVEIGCHHDLKVHVQMANGFLCRTCAWRRPGVTPAEHCSGGAMQNEVQKNYIHAPANWHGLMYHRAPIHVYGDVNDGGGNAASIAGGSIKILSDIFAEHLGERVEFHFPKVNPLVKLRVLAVNLGLCDADQIASIFVGTWCEAHIADFREVIPDPKTGHPLKVSKSPSQRKAGNDYWKRTDISDAFGYHWAFRHPFRLPQSGGMPIGQDDEFNGPHASGWAQP